MTTRSGWASARLPDLIAPGGVFVDGDWVESKDQDPQGAVRLTQLADVGDGVWKNRSSRFMTVEKARELRCTLLRKGDVLIARMPDPLGRSCVFPGDARDCVTVVDVCVVRPASEGIINSWLSHFVNAPEFRLSLNDLQSGSTRQRISRKNLGTLKLPVPPSREQRRIVEAIESYFTRLDDAVATLERVQRNLKRYRASVLKAAVEGRLVPTEAELARAEGRDYEPASALLERVLTERRRCWEESELVKIRAKRNEPTDDKWKAKYEEPVPVDISDVANLPEGWAWTTLDEVTTVIDGGAATTATSQPTSRRVLRSSAVRQGSIDFADHRFLPNDSPARENSLLVEGDLLFTRLSGTLAYVGNCAVVPSLFGESFEFPDRIFRARVSSLVLGEYVSLCFGALHLRLPLEAAAKSSAGHQRISLSDLREFKIPRPPQVEQSRIVAEVERLGSVGGSVEAGAKRNATRSWRLRQCILKWAFEGRLADQDPTDEPASVLLERIRAERQEPA